MTTPQHETTAASIWMQENVIDFISEKSEIIIKQ